VALATPAGSMELIRSYRSNDGGLPHITVGSAPALSVSRPAQRSLGLQPADSPSRLAGVHHLLHIDACLGQSLQMLFPILGIHNGGSFFAPVDAILVERPEHSVFLVDGVEERADMIWPGEIDAGEIY
jgi:hypothetical protein